MSRRKMQLNEERQEELAREEAERRAAEIKERAAVQRDELVSELFAEGGCPVDSIRWSNLTRFENGTGFEFAGVYMHAWALMFLMATDTESSPTVPNVGMIRMAAVRWAEDSLGDTRRVSANVVDAADAYMRATSAEASAATSAERAQALDELREACGEAYALLTAWAFVEAAPHRHRGWG